MPSNPCGLVLMLPLQAAAPYMASRWPGTVSGLQDASYLSQMDHTVCDMRRGEKKVTPTKVLPDGGTCRPDKLCRLPTSIESSAPLGAQQRPSKHRPSFYAEPHAFGDINTEAELPV